MRSASPRARFACVAATCKGRTLNMTSHDPYSCPTKSAASRLQSSEGAGSYRPRMFRLCPKKLASPLGVNVAAASLLKHRVHLTLLNCRCLRLLQH